jgi:hypothetical protein
VFLCVLCGLFFTARVAKILRNVRYYSDVNYFMLFFVICPLIFIRSPLFHPIILLLSLRVPLRSLRFILYRKGR